MSKIRRIGRELALKALFQLEVGKQPIEEVLQGTRLQIVDLACQPAFQAVQESISECKAVLAPLELDMSVPSKRQIRKLASDCSSYCSSR